MLIKLRLTRKTKPSFVCRGYQAQLGSEENGNLENPENLENPDSDELGTWVRNIS